jgi:hypothetical protein
VRDLDVERVGVAPVQGGAAEPWLVLADGDRPEWTEPARPHQVVEAAGQCRGEPLRHDHDVEAVCGTQPLDLGERGGIGGEWLLHDEPREPEPGQPREHRNPGVGRGADVHHRVGRRDERGGSLQ